MSNLTRVGSLLLLLFLLLFLLLLLLLLCLLVIIFSHFLSWFLQTCFFNFKHLSGREWRLLLPGIKSGAHPSPRSSPSLILIWSSTDSLIHFYSIKSGASRVGWPFPRIPVTSTTPSIERKVQVSASCLSVCLSVCFSHSLKGEN